MCKYKRIFGRSFSKNERKRLGYGAFGSLIMAISISIVFRHYLCQLSLLHLQKSKDASLEKMMIKNTISSQHHLGVTSPLIKSGIVLKESEPKELKPICIVMEPRTDFCEITGDIRDHGNSSTVNIASLQNGILVENNSWNIRPYSRKENAAVMSSVKN
ncbi:hypothetical protein QYF36_005127 [Acer negundo]|nr:hypothetical protein QYF36_005127 [Acer negundo]